MEQKIIFPSPLSEEEVMEISKHRKRKQKLHNQTLEKNKNDYFKNRSELLNLYEGKYIAFSGGKILGVSESSYDIMKYIEEDSTTFTTCVGNENHKSNVDNIISLEKSTKEEL
jgi:hypothetical protein